MNPYFLPGAMGLLLGLLLHWTGFSKGEGLRKFLGLRRSYILRSGLTALGFALAMTAFLMWLAVIDVDTVEPLPLSLGALVGGGVLGVAAGLCGFTPLTAFAGLGAGRAAEAFCVLAGCLGGTLLLKVTGALLQPLHTMPPYAPATLFQVTLDEPFLLGGGFLGQGCVGALLWVIALCVPSPKPVILTDAQVAQRAAEIDEKEEIAQDAPAEELPPEEPEAPEDAPPPEPPLPADDPALLPASELADDVSSDAFISLLEGEEPLVVDTDPDDP